MVIARASNRSIAVRMAATIVFRIAFGRLEEDADHCTLVHHRMASRTPLPSIVLVFDSPLLSSSGSVGCRQEGRLAMSRPAGTVMGKVGEGREGMGWRADWWSISLIWLSACIAFNAMSMASLISVVPAVVGRRRAAVSGEQPAVGSDAVDGMASADVRISGQGVNGYVCRSSEYVWCGCGGCGCGWWGVGVGDGPGAGWSAASKRYQDNKLGLSRQNSDSGILQL